MGEEWKKARDARVAEQKKRMTIFGGYELQQKMVNDIKAPMKKVVSVFFNPKAGRVEKMGALLEARRAIKTFQTFPEPTAENTWHPNSHILIGLREEFFKHCYLDASQCRIMRLMMNFVIVIYDYDPPYRMMIDWWARQLKIQNWRYDVPVTVVGHNWPWWKE